MTKDPASALPANPNAAGIVPATEALSSDYCEFSCDGGYDENSRLRSTAPLTQLGLSQYCSARFMPNKSRRFLTESRLALPVQICRAPLMEDRTEQNQPRTITDEEIVGLKYFDQLGEKLIPVAAAYTLRSGSRRSRKNGSKAYCRGRARRTWIVARRSTSCSSVSWKLAHLAGQQF